jgi:O-antigen/teichoic acid export membrane protein
MSEDLNGSLSTIASGTSTVMFGTLVGYLSAYLAWIVVARFIGPAGYGLIILATTVVTTVGVLCLLGQSQGIIRFISMGDGTDTRSILTSALVISLPISILSAVALFIFADRISVAVFGELGLIPVLRIAAIALPLLVLAKVIESGYNGLKQMDLLISIRDIAPNCLRLICVIIAVFCGFGLIGVAWAYALAVILPPLLFLPLVHRAFPKKGSKISINHELVRYSIPLFGARAVEMFMSYVDIFMIGILLTVAQVGIYRSAFMIEMFFLALTSSIMTIFFPVITNLYHINNHQELEHTIRMVTKWMMMVLLPLLSFIVIFRHDVINLLVGPEYILGADTMAVLAIGVTLISFLYPVTNMLYVTGRTKFVMLNTTAGFILDIVFNYFLILRFGILGAAIATSASLILIQIWAYYEVQHTSPIHTSTNKYYGTVAFSALAPAFILYFVFNHLSSQIKDPLVCIALFSILYTLIYITLLCKTRSFEEGDFAIVNALEDKTGHEASFLRFLIECGGSRVETD